MGFPWRRFGASCVLLLSCGQATAPRSPAPARSAWRYEIDASAPPMLTVVATFERVPPKLVMELAPEGVEREERGAWITVRAQNDAWTVPSCAERCTVRYTIDLRRGANDLDHVKSGSPGRQAFLAPSYAWLIRPEPIPVGTLTLAIKTAPQPEPAPGVFAPASFMSGLFPTMTTRDYGEGSFAAFGSLRRARVSVGESAIDVAVLGDRPLALGDAGVLRWTERAARAVARLYGRFPAPKAALFVTPVPEADEVVFGKVLSLGGPSIATFVGSDFAASSSDDDWVLVHEMVHLGFPTFLGEGRWLGEGVATYYEPILRARSGMMTTTELWRAFHRSMPRSEPSGGELALEKRSDIDSIYWGGALFCFMADVRIRKETQGKKSLDDVMRGVFERGGDATQVESVADVLREGDAITGTRVLTELHAQLAMRGARVDARAELAEIGVGAQIDDRAPFAWIRRKIEGSD